MAGSKEPISWQNISWTPEEKKDIEQNAPSTSPSASSSVKEKPNYDEQPWLDPKHKAPLRHRSCLLWIGLTFLLLATIGAVVGMACYLSTRGSHASGSNVRTYQTDRGTTYGVAESTNQYTPKKRSDQLWETTEAQNFGDIFRIYTGGTLYGVRGSTNPNPTWISGKPSKEKRDGIFVGAIKAWSSGSIFSTHDRQSIGSQDYSTHPGSPPPGFSENIQPQIMHPDGKH